VIDYARMARQFPENGLKLLLENPRNVQEFLPLSRSRLVPSIDCEHLQRVNTTFVQRDYSHVACDLRGPFRSPAARRAAAPGVPVGFAQVLTEEVAALEPLREQERGRWLELLSYLMALVYHDRAKAEHNDLQEMVEVTVHADPERQEVHEMGQTMAQYLEEKGKKRGEKQGMVKGLQEALLLQLEMRFGAVPSDTEAAIRATTKLRQLKEWLRHVVSATTLKEMEIGPPT
jgi:hypothetical protein